MTRDPDRGQITILVIGFAVVVLLLIGVVVSASSVFVQRRSLNAWADGAALSAVQNVSEQAIYAGTVADALPLSAEAVRESVAAYAVRHRLRDRFAGFRVTSVAVDESRGVVAVTFSAVVDLPFGRVLGSEGASRHPIEATATATAPLVR